ncbi:aspartate/glutamate racemase [Paraburkholderia bryophila]|uniref:Aspartate/glutamate racemase n=2 Tax=Paraburkholderia TaxID=1822464 RepID=A0A7Y9WE58_9BURK|nr:aspartate/glutamate racemase [Paraburkholderia bryophila]
MLTCTADYLRDAFPDVREIGVLATTGTLASGVYESALEASGFVQIAPRAPAQTRLMNAIYGPNGAKAGSRSGECCEDLAAAIDDLVAQGVQVIVLGCTELPLLMRDTAPSGAGAGAGGQTVRFVDPTDVLARRCVAYALGASGALESAVEVIAPEVGAPAALTSESTAPQAAARDAKRVRGARTRVRTRVEGVFS